MTKRSAARGAIGASVLSILLLASIPPVAAQQRTWRSSSHQGGDRTFIDTSSIRRDGAKVRFLRELRFAEPQGVGSGFDRLLSLIEVDCEARTIQTLERTVKLGEEVVASGSDYEDPQPVRRRTTADVDLRAVCFDDWPRS